MIKLANILKEITVKKPSNKPQTRWLFLSDIIPSTLAVVDKDQRTSIHIDIDNRDPNKACIVVVDGGITDITTNEWLKKWKIPYTTSIDGEIKKYNFSSKYLDIPDKSTYVNEIKVEKPKQITAKEVWNYMTIITIINRFETYYKILDKYGYHESELNVYNWLKTLPSTQLANLYKDLKSEFGKIDEIKVEKPNLPYTIKIEPILGYGKKFEIVDPNIPGYWVTYIESKNAFIIPGVYSNSLLITLKKLNVPFSTNDNISIIIPAKYFKII
jgi:hypothetical protein